MSKPEQAEIIAFLASGAAFGGVPPEHIETSVSHLFLDGAHGYKLKKVMLLDYLDYSTLERRHEMCERELRLNRRSAPEIYLGAVPITWDGRDLALDGKGEPVEWVVKMRQFDQATLFDRLAHTGELSRALVAELTEAILEFHAGAEVRSDMGGADEMHRVARFVASDLERFGDSLLDADEIVTWDLAVDNAFSRSADLLDHRRDAGFVRQCHGDMHLGNICLYDGRATLFDCIEFSDQIACVDVLYDLAFLCMDLTFHGLEAHANLVMNRYLSATRDFAGLDVFPAFLSLRAAIRAMTGAMEAQDKGSENVDACHDAIQHLDYALAALQRPQASLIGVGGLSGSGKSTLAGGLATRICAGAGAVIVSSDVIRKRLYGVAPETDLPPEAYRGEVSARTYARLYEDVDQALRAGQTVIADATFIREQDRAALEDVAEGWGIPFAGLWLDAPADVLKARADARVADASDADRAVIDAQLAQSTGSMAWTRIDAAGDNPVEAALALLSGKA